MAAIHRYSISDGFTQELQFLRNSLLNLKSSLGRNHMHVRNLSKVGLAGVLAASFGFLSQADAAPLAGVSAAASAVESSAKAMPMEAVPQTVHYYHRYHHYHHHHRYHYHT